MGAEKMGPENSNFEKRQFQVYSKKGPQGPLTDQKSILMVFYVVLDPNASPKKFLGPGVIMCVQAD